VSGARIASIAGLLAALLAANESSAADLLDGKQALRCSTGAISQCDLAALCEPVAAEDIGLPPALRVDFAAKHLASTDGARTSPIHHIEVSEAVLVVQGSQNGRGWSLVIDRTTGRMAASVADAEGGFVVSGSCAAE
jgi:hypothetical protein